MKSILSNGKMRVENQTKTPVWENRTKNAVQEFNLRTASFIMNKILYNKAIFYTQSWIFICKSGFLWKIWSIQFLFFTNSFFCVTDPAFFPLENRLKINISRQKGSEAWFWTLIEEQYVY